jgi:type IV pilus assembly protein PilE
MQKKTANLRGRMGGVTLIELMIVVVVVGILAAIAYPSYQNQVRKSKRAEGKAELLETAQELERCYTRFGRYNDGNCPVVFPITSQPDGHYELTAPTLTTVNFTLEAAPQGDQANDADCGTLRLTSTGVQGSQGADADANDCW